jgi:D-xylose transport system ATP-binding protein
MFSFEAREGEVLGVAGLMGSGRSELAMTIFGEYGSNREGEILLDGQPIVNKFCAGCHE